MPQFLHLLALSVVGFPRLESFLVGPATSAAWLDPRPVLTQRRARNRDECPLSRATRARDANHNRARRSTTPPSLFAAKNDDGAASSASEAGGEPRQRKKRPRKHVPVLEDSISGEPVVGMAKDEEMVDLEPWMGLNARKSTSTLPEPTFKERKSFERIMEDVLGVEKNEELPGILTKHVEFLLSVDVTRLTNDLIREEPTMDRVVMLRNAYDFIVTFLEGMVESTIDVQRGNQKLLREIIEAAKIGPSQFETKMEKLQDRFSYEFVKYLDAEVERLEKVGKPSELRSGGDEVLNVMRIVRTRVCAQVDLTMGEDVAILTRMLSYDDRFMMRAALKGVFRDKPPQTVEAFRKLVSITLKDVAAMGSGVDPVLRCKLGDMEEDLAVVARDVEDRRKQREEEKEKA